MEETESINRRRLFLEGRVFGWCNIDRCAIDRIARDTEP